MNKNELREYVNKDIENLRSLNFSETYIKSVSENTIKWGSTGLLNGLNNTNIGRNIATLMENQRLFNQQWPGDETSLIPEGAETDYSVEDWATVWKRCSIPCLRRVFGEFVGNELVSVQAMKSAQENTYLTGFDGRISYSITEANTRRLISEWKPPMEKDLNLEAEFVVSFSKEVRDDFSREIIRDLALNASKLAVCEYKDESDLLSLIEGMSNYIAAKCYNREATWVVTSPEIVKLLEEFIKPIEFRSHVGVNKVGMLNDKWQLFEDSTAPSGNILLGHKDLKNHFGSGYVFAPYLPMNPTPAWRTDKQEQNGQVFARYGKRLVNPDFYGALKIENLPQITPLVASAEAESEE